MIQYRDTAYLEDDDAFDGLAILERDGAQAAIDHLLQLDKDTGKIKKRLIAPGHRRQVGKYILYYDRYAAHIGLLEVLK